MFVDQSGEVAVAEAVEDGRARHESEVLGWAVQDERGLADILPWAKYPHDPLAPAGTDVHDPQPPGEHAQQPVRVGPGHLDALTIDVALDARDGVDLRSLRGRQASKERDRQRWVCRRRSPPIASSGRGFDGNTRVLTRVDLRHMGA